MTFRDNRQYYGFLSRLLHWGMALLMLWQFGGMLLKDIIGRTPFMGFWVGSHATVGFMLLVLVMLRGLWALTQRNQRPPHQRGVIGTLAKLGHFGLYGLMVVVPALALLRMFGNDRGAKLFGIQITQPGGDKVEWMMAPANLLHGNLAWVLLVLIAGHIAMVGIHQFMWRDKTLSRMAGSPNR